VGKKKTIYDVRKMFASKGWELISDKYVRADGKLLCRCPNDHIKTTTYHIFQQNKCKCSRCAGNYKKTALEIKNLLGVEGYIFISIEEHRKIKYMCSNGHINTVSLHHFIGGTRCKECVINNKKLKLTDVKKTIKDKGWQLLSTNYKNAREKLHCICEKGHEIFVPYYSIKFGVGCGICFGNKKKSLKDVEEYVEHHGYEVLENKEYENSKSKLHLLCPNKHIYVVSVNNFKRGYRCIKCKPGRVSKISQKWLNLMKVPDLNREQYVNIDNHKMFVDGINKKTATVYEFLGDFWHGHPTKIGENQVVKKSFKSLYITTILRLSLLLKKYNLVCVWEYEFKNDLGFHYLEKGTKPEIIDKLFKENINE